MKRKLFTTILCMLAFVALTAGQAMSQNLDATKAKFDTFTKRVNIEAYSDLAEALALIDAAIAEADEILDAELQDAKDLLQALYNRCRTTQIDGIDPEDPSGNYGYSYYQELIALLHPGGEYADPPEDCACVLCVFGEAMQEALDAIADNDIVRVRDAFEALGKAFEDYKTGFANTIADRQEAKDKLTELQKNVGQQFSGANSDFTMNGKTFTSTNKVVGGWQAFDDYMKAVYGDTMTDWFDPIANATFNDTQVQADWYRTYKEATVLLTQADVTKAQYDAAFTALWDAAVAYVAKVEELIAIQTAQQAARDNLQTFRDLTDTHIFKNGTSFPWTYVDGNEASVDATFGGFGGVHYTVFDKYFAENYVLVEWFDNDSNSFTDPEIQANWYSAFWAAKAVLDNPNATAEELNAAYEALLLATIEYSLAIELVKGMLEEGKGDLDELTIAARIYYGAGADQHHPNIGMSFDWTVDGESVTFHGLRTLGYEYQDFRDFLEAFYAVDADNEPLVEKALYTAIGAAEAIVLNAQATPMEVDAAYDAVIDALFGFSDAVLDYQLYLAQGELDALFAEVNAYYESVLELYVSVGLPVAWAALDCNGVANFAELLESGDVDVALFRNGSVTTATFEEVQALIAELEEMYSCMVDCFGDDPVLGDNCGIPYPNGCGQCAACYYAETRAALQALNIGRAWTLYRSMQQVQGQPGWVGSGCPAAFAALNAARVKAAEVNTRALQGTATQNEINEAYAELLRATDAAEAAFAEMTTIANLYNELVAFEEAICQIIDIAAGMSNISLSDAFWYAFFDLLWYGSFLSPNATLEDLQEINAAFVRCFCTMCWELNGVGCGLDECTDCE